MKKLLVDTDIIIDCLRLSRRKTLFKSLVWQKRFTIFIAAVTITELWRGKSIEKTKEKARLNRLLNKINIVVADKKISKKAGELLRIYLHLTLADSLVAATAILNKYPLITFNQKHFVSINELTLFKFEEHEPEID